MRGEDDSPSALFDDADGSPPHARGRRGELSGMSRTRRITPACAGKTRAPKQASLLDTDHPRMRGEDTVEIEGMFAALGSPPHARGRLPYGPFRSSSIRITPACAGKTVGPTSNLTVSSDHPRMRGEDIPTARAPARLHGSPPHARGRLLELKSKNYDLRITPACAGKTDRAFA